MEENNLNVALTEQELKNVGFEIGTDREEIWCWFKETFNLSVADDLMYRSFF